MVLYYEVESFYFNKLFLSQCTNIEIIKYIYIYIVKFCKLWRSCHDFAVSPKIPKNGVFQPDYLSIKDIVVFYDFEPKWRPSFNTDTWIGHRTEQELNSERGWLKRTLFNASFLGGLAWPPFCLVSNLCLSVSVCHTLQAVSLKRNTLQKVICPLQNYITGKQIKVSLWFTNKAPGYGNLWRGVGVTPPFWEWASWRWVVSFIFPWRLSPVKQLPLAIG
jgi:hypothetical protein